MDFDDSSRHSRHPDSMEYRSHAIIDSRSRNRSCFRLSRERLDCQNMFRRVAVEACLLRTLPRSSIPGPSIGSPCTSFNIDFHFTASPVLSSSNCSASCYERESRQCVSLFVDLASFMLVLRQLPRSAVVRQQGLTMWWMIPQQDGENAERREKLHRDGRSCEGPPCLFSCRHLSRWYRGGRS